MDGATGKGLMMRTKFCFVNVVANANPPQPAEQTSMFRDIHGATYLFKMELRHLSPVLCLAIDGASLEIEPSTLGGV